MPGWYAACTPDLDKLMAGYPRHATTRSPRYMLGPGADTTIARAVLAVLIVVGLVAVFLVSSFAKAGPSPAAKQLANFDPRALLAEQTPHFLPTPVAAIPPDQGAGPPPAAAAEEGAAGGGAEQVKVVNTGGAGAILRAEPPRGRQVAALRDGQVLTVIERQSGDADAWVHVKTQDGTEGWVYGRLVGPAS